MDSVLASGSLVAALALAALSNVAATSPTATVGVSILNINGTGCKQGTVAVAMSPDNTAFTVGYSDYLARVGSDAKKNDADRLCRLNLRVGALTGYAYAIAKVDHRGYANLADGATAVQRASYRFHGSQRTEERTHSLTGPAYDDWQFTDVAQPDTLAFGPCGKASNLDIDTELTVSAGTSDPSTEPSYLTMDSTDGTVTTYHVTWQRCS